MPSIRLQKILAAAGLASRRQAEAWIREGRVRVNGRLAVLGDRADPDSDSIKVDDKRVRPPAGPKTYVLLNKPRGYVTTVSDPQQRDTVLKLLPEHLRRGVKPVGRLDVQTEGLLLLTDDGELARLVTHPSTGCSKEYRVKVSGVPAPKDLESLRHGILLDGRRTLPAIIENLSTTRGRGEGNTWLRVVLGEGRTRQIRRMFEAIGHPVSKLRRVAIGPIRDERLPVGAFRRLTEAEVNALRRSLRRLDTGMGGHGESNSPRVSAPPRPVVPPSEMTSPLIVAIDGPSGAGKSTVARALAERLGVPYIDTGAMYRAVGLAAREAGISVPISDPQRVSRLADGLEIELVPDPKGLRVLIDHRDVTEEIREPEVSVYASAVSAIPDVRRLMVAMQRRLAAAHGGVMEGRDIGTKVFPETPHKFFLTASPEVRAQRRWHELALRGKPQSFQAVLTEMNDRDAADRTRADSPLTLDDRYTVVDTTNRSVEDVVEEIEKRVRDVAGAGSVTG